MPGYCTNCGAKLPEGSQFCLSCGKYINEPAMITPQSQGYAPIIKSQILNKKILAIIATAIVVIIIIAIVLLVLLGSNYSFIGKWRIQTYGGPEVIWTVYENGSVLQEYSYNKIWGHWEQIGDQVCGYWDPYTDDYRCFTLEFSDDGNKITVFYQGQLFGTAIRID